MWRPTRSRPSGSSLTQHFTVGSPTCATHGTVRRGSAWYRLALRDQPNDWVSRAAGSSGSPLPTSQGRSRPKDSPTGWIHLHLRANDFGFFFSLMRASICPNPSKSSIEVGRPPQPPPGKGCVDVTRGSRDYPGRTARRFRFNHSLDRAARKRGHASTFRLLAMALVAAVVAGPISGTWQLPFHGPAANAAAKQLVDGWSLSGIATLQSGFPLSPQLGYNPTGNGDTRNPVRPNRVAGFSGPLYAKTVQQWFNPAAFSAPYPGTFGNAGRDTLTGPGLSELDLSLAKSTTIHERLRAQFRAEFFNVLNHSNFTTPNAVVYSSDPNPEDPYGSSGGFADGGGYQRNGDYFTADPVRGEASVLAILRHTDARLPRDVAKRPAIDLPRTRVPHISLVFREMWGATVGRPFTTWTDTSRSAVVATSREKRARYPEFPARGTGHGCAGFAGFFATLVACRHRCFARWHQLLRTLRIYWAQKLAGPTVLSPALRSEVRSRNRAGTSPEASGLPAGASQLHNAMVRAATESIGRHTEAFL